MTQAFIRKNMVIVSIYICTQRPKVFCRLRALFVLQLHYVLCWCSIMHCVSQDRCLIFSIPHECWHSHKLITHPEICSASVDIVVLCRGMLWCITSSLMPLKLPSKCLESCFLYNCHELSRAYFHIGPAVLSVIPYCPSVFSFRAKYSFTIGPILS